MRIFETHAHLDFADYDKDRDQVLRKCFESGVERIINIGIDLETSKNSIALAKKYKQIYATVGFHPSDAETYNEQALFELLKQPKVVGIGEIGLDYYRMRNTKEVQKKVFSRQVEIAVEKKLPIVVHNRDAHEDCLEILERHKPEKVVFHCFSGDELIAERILGNGWKISITGVVTFKNSQIDGVVRMLPKDQFFIETDCPFLAPVPHRGKRNAPYYLQYVIEKIAEIKRVSPRQVAEASYENAERFFGV